jgi:hypothetical protein
MVTRSAVIATLTLLLAMALANAAAAARFTVGGLVGYRAGLGAGLEGYFDISDRFQFVIGGGVDYFFDAELTGHDTTYSPDGDHVNPRDDYTYDDARDAVNALGLEGRAVIGISYRFGS